MRKNLNMRGLAACVMLLISGLVAQAQSSCPGFKTFTQGGWGSSPSGSNPGTFLNNNFAANFPAPTYLTIGCTNKLQLTSAAAVRAFLPNGTTPFVLPAGTRVNPTKNNFSNVFAGQLVALALNLRFDTNIPSFGSSSTNLKDLVIANGPFIGKTVQFLFDEANKKIGGCSAFNKTLSEYTTAIDNVNRNYDNGNIMGSFLVCPLTASCSASPALCFGSSTGSMSVSVNGGLAPFNYSWSGGVAGNTSTATGLAAGTYTVTITDASMQTTTTTCTVNQPSQLVANSTVNGNILCNGGTTTVTISASGGTAPYTGTGTFTVGAGSYSYTVTDANGCTRIVNVSVSQPSPLVAQASAGQILCNGGTTTVTVSGSGGTAPYSGTGTFTVVAGTYNYTVTDANGCSKNISVTVTEPSQLVAFATVNGNVLCHGGTTSVSITANGGTAPYTGTGIFSVGAGSYTYTVTDANGCTRNVSFTVTEPSPLVAQVNAGQILCNGGTTTVAITANGGTPPYIGTGNFTVVAGTYNYMITDANGCSQEVSVSVTEPTEVIATAVAAGSILCHGGSTEVTVSATGGTPDYYGTGTFTVVAGSYTYEVTDANGCPASTSIEIDEPSQLEVSIDAEQRVRCNNECNGVILSSVSGGTPSYTFDWSNGSTEANITAGCAGNYQLTVTDANGCEATSNEVELNNPEELVLSALLTVEDDDCGDDSCNGSASVEVSGGEPEYSFVWTGGSSDSNELTGLCQGAVVSVTVTDARGCEVNSEDAIITCTEQDCGPHKTFTQGGWGAVPRGNNPGVYLHANFDAAYPNGLTIGCGENTLSFYSAQEITDFLPEGGTADALPNLSVLTGQLVAASLNVGFDAYDANFAGSDVALGDMYTDAEGFEGMTVAQIVAAANEVIGGCSDEFSYTALNAVLTTINENFDNGTQDNGHLTCGGAAAGSDRSLVVSAGTERAAAFMLNVYPNPAVDVANVQISATRAEIFEIALYTMTGELVVKQQRSIPAGTTTLDLQVSELPSMAYVLRVTSANQNKTQIVEVR